MFLVLIIVGSILVDTAFSNQPPIFTHVDTLIKLPVNAPIGTNVSYVVASGGDSQTLTFSLSGNNANQLLALKTLGPKSVLVVTASTLNQMTSSGQLITFTIQVTDGVNPPIQQLCTIIVIDNTLNPPVFINVPYEADLSENSPNGTFILTVSATDSNPGIKGLVTYQLNNEQAMFSLNAVSGNISLIGQLDYTLQRTYVLQITALDGAGLNATTQVTINVLDMRLRPPFFINLPYLTSVFENVSLGKSVIQVSALNGNTGLPGLMTYTILSGDLGLFTINSSSGLITTCSQINSSNPALRVRNNTIEIIIMANTSSGSEDAMNWALVTITVTDINNHLPTFNQINYNATILRNSPQFTTLALNPSIVITDLNQGDSGTLKIYLEQNNQTFDAFDVLPVIGNDQTYVFIRVRNTTFLNSEKTGILSFSIVAEEYLTPMKSSSSATVTVYVEDVNLNLIQFAKDEYVATIQKNSSRGMFVAKITVANSGAYSSSKIIYSLYGPLAYLFLINTTTGEIYVNSTLESLPVVFLTIEASNDEGQRAYTLLEVILSDSDLPPVIMSLVYYGYIRENSLSFAFPIIVQAYDPDILRKNTIVYSIKGEGSDGFYGIFNIGKYSGQVEILQAFDSEALSASAPNGTIELIVTAAYETEPSVNSTTTVVIYVEDTNDEAPYFLQNTYYVKVMDNISSGTNIVNVTAKDLDQTSPNNLLSYFIKSGSFDKFLIDSNTGSITLASDMTLDCLACSHEYLLSVIAVDGGVPALTGSTTINITVLDSHSRGPAFVTEKKFLASVRNDALVGASVFQCEVSDQDSSAILEYSILNRTLSGLDVTGQSVTNIAHLATLFGINSKTGLVFIKSALNGESLQMITLTLCVVDVNTLSTARLNDTASLTIIIETNDNDNNNNSNKSSPLLFLPNGSILTVYISQTSLPGTSVGRLVAIDSYQYTGSILYYVIYNSVASGMFEITDENRETGIVSLKSSLFPLTFEIVNLTIMATKSSQPDLNSTALLQVMVLSSSTSNTPPQTIHIPPQFEQKLYSAYASRSTPIGTTLLTVHALDFDNTAVITYSVDHGLGNGSWLFGIDPILGVAWVSASLEAIVAGDYFFTVVANDRGSPPLSSSVVVCVTVNNSGLGQQNVTNFIAPRFTRNWFIAGILPDVQIGEPVINLAEFTKNDGNTSFIFSLGEDFQITPALKDNLDNLKKHPFIVERFDGIILTNTYFQETWTGYINFDVCVNVSNHAIGDCANATVYLLTDNQRVKIVMNGNPNEISSTFYDFVEFLSNITSTFVGINTIQTHTMDNGNPDLKQTDLFIYSVDPSYQNVYNAMILTNLIDAKYSEFKETFIQFNVTAIMPPVEVIEPQSLSSLDRSLIIGFAVVGAFLLLLVFLFCFIFFFCKKKYKRKIKAANAVASVSGMVPMSANSFERSDRNHYGIEGSNPEWQENVFYNLSDSESRNSSDETTPHASSGGSQEEIIINSKKNSKMPLYKINGFNESRTVAYSQDHDLPNQNRIRRLVPVKDLDDEKPSVNGNKYVVPSTNV